MVPKHSTERPDPSPNHNHNLTLTIPITLTLTLTLTITITLTLALTITRTCLLRTCPMLPTYAACSMVPKHSTKRPDPTPNANRNHNTNTNTNPNQDLNPWDVSNVANIRGMFDGAEALDRTP